MAHVILVRRLVVHKFVVLFVKREVGQMACQLVFAQLGIVLVNCESGESLVVNVDAPGVHTRDHHVDSQVEFETFDQEGVRDVLRDNTVFIDWNLGDVINL